MREYDFLDFRNDKFNMDFLDFNRKVQLLKDTLRTKLETSYSDIWDTSHAFQYLARFQKLAEVLDIEDMESKHKRMINTFKTEMERVGKFFKKQQGLPPVPRNFPDISGRIYWVRSLLSHLRWNIL